VEKMLEGFKVCRFVGFEKTPNCCMGNSSFFCRFAGLQVCRFAGLQFFFCSAGRLLVWFDFGGQGHKTEFFHAVFLHEVL